AMKDLLPHVTLLTPNARELEILVGADVRSLGDAVAAGKRILDKLGVAVLVKGGHLGGAASPDVLVEHLGITQLAGARIEGGEDEHGTGCALSSAIAAHLALGEPLLEACRAAKRFVAARIAAPARPGRGAASVV
ncbi:MAG: PfkB family carbohydrate kinase, partial [Proteobacteria bacterium]|nr:PfkB family carbohydrate kinase [Pseudomonadota bacterium]